MEKKQNSSSLISSIYKSRKNIIDLMKKQNYNVNEYANFSINEVNSMYQNKQLDISLEKCHFENNSCLDEYPLLYNAQSLSLSTPKVPVLF